MRITLLFSRHRGFKFQTTTISFLHRISLSFINIYVLLLYFGRKYLHIITRNVYCIYLDVLLMKSIKH